jgi:SEFIR domain
MPEATEGPTDTANPKTAFVTWAHDDHAWEEKVAALVFALRQLGVAADVDLFHVNEAGVNWATYGARAIEVNEFVLIVASRAFRERWEGTNNPRLGAGAAREANVLKGIFDEDQREFSKKVKIVLLPGASVEDIPLELRASGQRFDVASFDLSGLEELLRTLTDQRAYIPPPVDTVPILPPRFIPGDTGRSSVTDLESHLAHLEDRRSEQVTSGSDVDEVLDTERTMVKAALQTFGQVRADAVTARRSKERSRARRRRIQRLLTGSLASLAVVGIAAWLVLASGGDASASSTVRTGPLQLTFAKPWHTTSITTTESFPGLEFEAPVSLAVGTASLEAGSLRNSAATPGGLPGGVEARIAQPVRRSTVSIGRATAVRYLWGSSASVSTRALFVVATGSGDLAVACQSPDPTKLADCLRIAESMRIAGTSVLSPGSQPLVAKGIDAALRPALVARRASARLASSHASVRAASARQLAVTDAVASTSFARLAAPERIKPMLRDVSVALKRESQALARFARPAGRHEAGPYRTARVAVEAAARQLASALERTRAAGYSASLPALSIPQSSVSEPHRATTSAVSTHVSVVSPVSTSPSYSSPAAVPKAPKKREYGPTIITEPKG